MLGDAYVVGRRGVAMGQNGIRRIAAFLLAAVIVYAAVTGIA